MNANDLNSIEQRLRSEAPRRSISPGFSERVIDALPSGRTPARAESPPPQSLWPRLALAGALAVVTFFGWARFSPKPEPAAPILVHTAEKPSNPMGIQLSAITLDQVQALTTKLEDPLEKELKLVLSDTKNAIRFVAANFMPEN